MKKLYHQRYGPFKIIKKIGVSAYKLALPKTWRDKQVHDVFNESLLKPYVAPYFKNQVVAPAEPPKIVQRKDGAEIEYVVDKIIDSKIAGRKAHTKHMLYKVKWQGESVEEATWEPVENLEGAKRAVASFHKKYPDKPKPADLPHQ